VHNEGEDAGGEDGRSPVIVPCCPGLLEPVELAEVDPGVEIVVAELSLCYEALDEHGGVVEQLFGEGRHLESVK